MAAPVNFIWKDLITWVKEHAGHVHANLELRSMQGEHRGVFASKAIDRGEVLIRLPAVLALDGTEMPVQYERNGSSVQVSPWLRCVAAYYRAAHGSNDSDIPQWKPYLSSLPASYQTLFQWTSQERTYLAHTSLEKVASEEPMAPLRLRYQEQVRPYLECCRLVPAVSSEEEEIQIFALVCQAVSTRCFHLQQSTHGSTVDSTSCYAGPYFLPVIDMLNHSRRQKCTTLTRDEHANFCMVVERHIATGEEVLHSYGDLTAAQLLQTFGFVPNETMEDAIASHSEARSCLTPALLSKQSILEACWSVIRSRLPDDLAASMKEEDMEDEVWNVSVDESRIVPFIADTIAVSAQSGSFLTDELVTVACAPFLPSCAYAEARESLLDSSILDDYFLGKLVCTALLKVIQAKCESYEPLRDEQAANDQAVLRQLLAEDDDRHSCRLMYALAVRLEEKESLQGLRRRVVAAVAALDSEGEHEGAGAGGDQQWNKSKLDAL